MRSHTLQSQRRQARAHPSDVTSPPIPLPLLCSRDVTVGRRRRGAQSGGRRGADATARAARNDQARATHSGPRRSNRDEGSHSRLTPASGFGLPPHVAAALAAAAADDDDDDSDSSPSSALPAAPAPFPIPTLPAGRRLTLNLLSTHGDPFYIGLGGLEIFDGRGLPLDLSASPAARIWASPADLNVLPGVSGDPRVVTNLVDGVNGSTDDLHAWLAPFSADKRHVVVVELAAPTVPTTPVAISLIRIWNYHKSRIHSTRGVRQLQLLLDGRLIFEGEVARAGVADAEAAARCSENILFTTDPAVLARIAAASVRRASQSAAGAGAAAAMARGDEFDAAVAEAAHRPATGDSSARGDRGPLTDPLDAAISVHTNFDLSVVRPKTSAHPRLAAAAAAESSIAAAAHSADSAALVVPAASASSSLSSGASFPTVLAREITVHLVSTWGDQYFVGLSGLAVLDGRGRPLPLSADCLSAFPRDVNAVPGHSGDNRTLDKLCDGVNVTTNDNNMWLAPVLQPDEKHTLSHRQRRRGRRQLPGRTVAARAGTLGGLQYRALDKLHEHSQPEPDAQAALIACMLYTST